MRADLLRRTPDWPEWQRSVRGRPSVIRLLPVTDAIARPAAEHLRRYRRSHSGIDLVDDVVAATAELHDAELVTLNVRRIPMVRGLRAPW